MRAYGNGDGDDDGAKVNLFRTRIYSGTPTVLCCCAMSGQKKKILNKKNVEYSLPFLHRHYPVETAAFARRCDPFIVYTSYTIISAHTRLSADGGCHVGSNYTTVSMYVLILFCVCPFFFSNFFQFKTTYAKKKLRLYIHTTMSLNSIHSAVFAPKLRLVCLKCYNYYCTIVPSND